MDLDLTNSEAKLPETKFLILCQYRTGSTLLATLINSHPGLYCDHEIFNAGFTGNYSIIFPVSHIYKNLQKNIRAKHISCYGFDFKIHHIGIYHPLINASRLVEKLYNRGWKIISLRRENVVKQAISCLVARNRKKWHYWTEEEKLQNHKKVYIKPDQLFRILKEIDRITCIEDKILKNLSYQRILYEKELLRKETHQKTADKVFQHLKLPSVPVGSQLIRASSDQISDQIQDFDQIRDAICNSKWAKYLDFEIKNPGVII
jgi:hypothetical protein